MVFFSALFYWRRHVLCISYKMTINTEIACLFTLFLFYFVQFRGVQILFVSDSCWYAWNTCLQSGAIALQIWRRSAHPGSWAQLRAHVARLQQYRRCLGMRSLKYSHDLLWECRCKSIRCLQIWKGMAFCLRGSEFLAPLIHVYKLAICG